MLLKSEVVFLHDITLQALLHLHNTFKVILYETIQVKDLESIFPKSEHKIYIGVI